MDLLGRIGGVDFTFFENTKVVVENELKFVVEKVRG